MNNAKKILIVEDQAPMRRNTALMLELEGYLCCTAANGREGVEMARAEKPDLILCDVMMPELDGYGMLQELRQDPDFAATPFIFLSAKGDQNEFRNALSLGANAFLAKPTTHEELMGTVRQHLST